MADGTPDFTDLLAAFDEAPVVTLHQISSGVGPNAQVAGGGQLTLNQPGVTAQTHGQFPVGHTLAASQNQLDQIVGLNPNAGLSGQTFIQSSASNSGMEADDTFGGGVGSLGSMFLSSVESMLSDETTTSFVMPIPQATAKAVQRKPRQQRPKQTMPQQQSRAGSLPQNKNLQNVNVQPFGNINPTMNPVPTTYSMQNTALNADAIGMKMSVASPPFLAQNELQQGPGTLPLAGQQKPHQAAFVHPNQGPRQSQLPSNPPRPLSAASSSSEHISHPGSVPQPSPSCGSNHSGDPATPLTPQSYNAGTPQSYKPATPQSYKPATPQSNPQQAIPQRSAGYGDVHQQPQQILPGMSTGTLENFVQNPQSTIQYQPQRSPMQPLNASNETLNDLPTPLKEAFIPQTTSANFESHGNSPISNDNQLWNSGPAVMAPSALFMSTSQSKVTGNPTFASAESQLGYGFTDMYGMPLQHAFSMSRQESNVRSESLTSKQNELLDQMSSFGKAKKQQLLSNLALDSNLSTMEKYSDITKPDAGIAKNSDNTMNLMNKANDAGSAAVKELLGSQYEAISPVSDYSMSPHKSTLHDDLSEAMVFSSSKFSTQPDLSLPHDVNNSGQDPLTDPVLMYLKHDDERISSKNNNSNAMSSSVHGGNGSNFLLQGAHMQDTAKSQSNWISNQTPVTANTPLPNLSHTLHYSSTAQPGLKTSQFSDSMGQSQISMQSGNWNSSLPLTTLPATQSTSPAQCFSSSQSISKTSQDGVKNLPSSPVKQRVQPQSPGFKNVDKRFGVSRRKTSVDRAKSGSTSKGKKTSSFDSNFGFDDDGTAEPTICLSKASPKAGKKTVKTTQPNLVSPKARVAPSKDISVTMEQLKVLQQQQEMLLKLQRRYQSQGAANTASNMQNNAHLLAAKAAHYDSSRRLSSEKDATAQNLIQNPSASSQSVTSIAKPPVRKPSPLSAPPKQVMDFPAPLSLAQPMVSPKFGDVSKMQLPAHNMPPTLPSVSQSSIQNTSMPSSSHGAQFPNFLGFLNIPASEHGLSSQIQTHSSSTPAYRAPPPRTLPLPLSSASSTIQSLLQRSEPYTLPAPGTSTTVSTGSFSSMPTHSSKTSFLPASTSSLSFPSSKLLSDPNSVAVSTAVPTMSSSRPQPFDSHFNFDWLNREPEPILSGKFKTPESASEATHTPKTLPLPVSTTTPIDLTSSAKVVSSASMPPDDVIPTLKQSIHTVHHLDVPKSQPPLSLPTVTPSTTKEPTPVPQETKHLNLRKHRILEGYPSENYKSTFMTHTTSSSITNTPVTAPARSVLDKQRKYSKDRSSLKPRHRIQHQVTDTPKQSVSTSASSAVTLKSQPNTGNKPEPKKSENSKEEKKDKAKDDQAGSMLLLFNSLLQEASESARQDSLKTTLSGKNDSDSVPKLDDITEAPSIVSDTRAKASKDTPKPAQVINKDLSATSITVTTSVTKVNTTQNDNVPLKKPAKKHRPAATVPFKRRPYPAFDDTATVPPPTTTTAMPVTTTVASLKSVVTSNTTTSTTSVISALTKPQITSTAVPKVTAPKVSIPAPDDEKCASKSSSLPKLRITLFRSAKGEVLHQSSMVGKASENADSEGGSHRKHHKKKKKKKRRRKISSSDNESVSSRTSKSSTTDQTAKLAREAKINEQITKELERKAQSILLKSMDAQNPSAPANPVTKETEDALKRKRKRTKATTLDDADKKKPPKRVRVSKTTNKKKQDSKTDEPVVRYQPKSVLHANSTSAATGSVTKTSVTLPSTFQRAPGKLPLYLNSSEANSATVPTIQLVARGGKQPVKTSSTEQKTQPAKVVSVKITNSIPNKSFTTQVLPNSAVQYIIPTTKGQQRVVFPNISLSTPVTVPVSIVSPLFARSFSGGFVPLSVGSVTTTTPTSTTKPQLFSVPVTLGEGSASSIKLLTKQPVKSHVDTMKSIATITSKTENEVVKLQPTQNSTVTVTKMLTTPRVTTKVISPGASSQPNANTFQSTFLKLIGSQNPVPTYTPPAPPPHLELDLSGRKQFQCLECKDSFMFSDSLDHHYDRRCILIKVRCMQCDEDLIFLNKCKLLLHARQHSNKGGNGMQFNNAHISPLPLSLCKPRSKEAFLDKTARSAAERQKSSVMSSEDETSSLSLSRQTSFPTVLACTDCNFSGSTPAELEEHFQRVSQPVSPEKSTTVKPSSAFTCELCSVSVPNQCSFMAHMRMHKRATPHTCPECGQTFDNDGLQEHAYSESRREIDFNLHLSVQCFHLSRMSAYKCRICNNIFKNAELLRRHLEDRHLQAFYKCRDCPMAFKTQENMSSHQRSAHGVVASTKMIHKCPLCDTVFTDNSHTQQLFLLRKHFEGHMSHPSINITAYKCLFCNNIYERKILLRDHLKSAHDVAASGDSGSGGELSKEINDNKLVINIEKKDSASTGRKRPLIKTSLKEPSHKTPKIMISDSGINSSASNLLIASGILGNRDSAHKKGSKNFSDSALAGKSTVQPLKLRLKGMSHPSNITMSVMSGNLSDDDVPITNIGTIMRDGRKVFPCGECSKELPSASARLNHIKLKHKGIRTIYSCPHCPPGQIRFAKKISLKKHLKKVHDIEEIKKQDVLMEYAKLPIGQKFDPAVLKLNKDNPQGIQQPPRLVRGENKVRKKFTGMSRKLSRPLRARREPENISPYVENSDSEVEQIMSKRSSEDMATEQTDNEEPDFSLLKLPNIYTCAKCEFHCEDRLEFQAHIIEHREDGECEGMLNTMQQCTECGLCFASVASHAKHLFIKHKIKRKKLLERYDRQLKAERAANGNLPLPLSMDGTASGVNGSALNKKKHKCTVCFKRFDDDGQLRTHMRNHGLAFVKSKHVS